MSIPARLRLAAEIAAEYVRVRRLLARRPLPAVLAAVREERLAAPPVRSEPPWQLAGGTRRVLAVLPVRSTCLFRSLVLIGLLARRGTRAQLVIAAEPGADLSAHAWVELEGRPLLPPERGYGRLAEL